jgi:hypothetical protein
MIPTALALIVLSADTPTRPTREPRSAAELYNAYRWYGLPLPPKDCDPVVVLWTERRLTSQDGEQGVRFKEELVLRLGLMVSRQDSRGLAEIWWGQFVEYGVRQSRLHLVRPTPDCLRDIDSYSLQFLCFAAHAYHLGWSQLASAAFERGLAEERISGDPHVLGSIRDFALSYAVEALGRPGADRRGPVSILAKLAQDEPRLRLPAAADFIKSHEAALRPSVAAPGSIESLIDGLTEVNEPSACGTDNAYSRLAGRGFDAVPDLIAHLDDNRATRHGMVPGCFGVPGTETQQVGGLCAMLLHGLAGNQLRPINEEVPGDDAERFREWYAAAKEVGEERWATTTTFLEAMSGRSVDDELVRLIGEKYPHRLPAMYRSMLRERSSGHSNALAAELAVSKIDRRLKLELLREGAGHAEFRHRRAALDAMAVLDRSEFLVGVRATLDWIAAGRVGDANAQEIGRDLVELNAKADDPACWDGVIRVVGVAPISLRICVLDVALDDTQPRGQNNPAGPLRVLEAALADDTIRVLTCKQRSYLPAEEYRRIAVQNFAALKLADYFDIDVPWDPARTRAEWADLREQVKAALAAERKRAK